MIVWSATLTKHTLNPREEENGISKQNLNEMIETLHVVPTQLCHLPGFYR